MKTPIVCFSLAMLTLVSGQDAANPFVKKADAAKPQPPSGASFVSLLENILVPPDLLDDWLREHPMKEDATALRAAVQGWVAEGKAKLDHTALNLGTAGRETTNSCILEKMYPTEFSPGGPGAWPWPTSFDTRNIGHDAKTGLSQQDAHPALWAEMSHVEMISSESYQALIERTRQSTDTFLPRFRSKRIQQNASSESSDPVDPFADIVPGSTSNNYFHEPHGLVFKPDLVQLAARFDPTLDPNPDGALSRLIFYRGSVAAAPKEKPKAPPEITRLSIRLVRASLPEFSAWLQTRPPLSVITESFEAAEGWRRAGKAESAGEISTQVRIGTRSTLENIEEFIYPTEWMPGNDTELIEQWEEGKKKGDKEGVSTMRLMRIIPQPGLDGGGRATSFDTRNLGSTLEAGLTTDDQGLVLNCDWARVVHLGNPVHHRVKVDDEWIPDITMPLFASSGIKATIRVQPGQWTLLGAVSEFLQTEKVDREHCLLVFVRVE